MRCNKLQKCAEEQFGGKRMTECPNNNFSNCMVSSDQRSKVKCEERRKKYILENTMGNHVISYKMDGGIVKPDRTVPEGTCKCDYLFLIGGSERSAILIELKGVDVTHALRQIRNVLRFFPQFFNSFSHVYGRVVSASSVLDLKANPDYVNLARVLRKTFRGNIKIAEKELSEKDIGLGQR